MWKTTAIAVIAGSIAVGSAVAKDKTQDMVMSFSVPVDRVYAAAVQVASAGYNLKSAVKEVYTVNFFTGGKFSMVVSAIFMTAATVALVSNARKACRIFRSINELFLLLPCISLLADRDQRVRNIMKGGGDCLLIVQHYLLLGFLRQLKLSAQLATFEDGLR